MFKTNQYFDGKVVSIAFEDHSGPATVGVMAPGTYEFGTSTREHMTVVSGSLTIRLPGATADTVFHPGESFEVEAGQSFGVMVTEDTSYLCRYGD
ncbi:MAG: pyrimidine/purine nucleoside phosphorylase [Kiritimatiellia bacterium]